MFDPCGSIFNIKIKIVERLKFIVLLVYYTLNCYIRTVVFRYNPRAQKILKQLLIKIGFDRQETRSQFNLLIRRYKISEMHIVGHQDPDPDIDIDRLLLEAGIIDPSPVFNVRNATRMRSLLRSKTSIKI